MSEKINLLNTNTTQIDPLIILSKRVVLNNSIEPLSNLYDTTKINISTQKGSSILLSNSGF
jgi:hypothetical protein